MAPDFIDRKVIIGAGEFLHMLGAYRRKGIVVTPKVTLVTINISVITRLTGVLLPVRATPVVTLDRWALLFDRLQSKDDLQRKTVESVVLTNRHPSVVLPEWGLCPTQFASRQEETSRALSVIKTTISLPVLERNTFFRAVASRTIKNLVREALDRLMQWTDTGIANSVERMTTL